MLLGDVQADLSGGVGLFQAGNSKLVVVFRGFAGPRRFRSGENSMQASGQYRSRCTVFTEKRFQVWQEAPRVPGSLLQTKRLMQFFSSVS